MGKGLMIKAKAASVKKRSGSKEVHVSRKRVAKVGHEPPTSSSSVRDGVKPRIRSDKQSAILQSRAPVRGATFGSFDAIQQRSSLSPQFSPRAQSLPASSAFGPCNFSGSPGAAPVCIFTGSPTPTCAAVTASSISATLGTDPPQTSTSTSTNFTTNPPFSVPQNVGTLCLQVNGLTPNNATSLACLGWCIQRNPQDATPLQGLPLPALTVNLTNPTQATLATTGVGSFNIVVWSGATSNILLVLNIAIIQATLQANTTSVAPSSAGISETTTGGHNFFYLGSSTIPAITFGTQSNSNFQFVLQGGGADERLGIAGTIYKMTVGFLQNATADNLKANYPNSNYEAWVLTLPPATFPILDATAGQIFGPGINNIPQFPFPTLGLLYNCPGFDAASRYYDTLFPGTTNAGTTVTGSATFTTCAAVVSSDFPSSYCILGIVQWSGTLNYTNVAGVWTNTGSTVTSTATAFNTNGCPQSAAAAGIITIPPVANSSLKLQTY